MRLVAVHRRRSSNVDDERVGDWRVRDSDQPWRRERTGVRIHEGDLIVAGRWEGVGVRPTRLGLPHPIHGPVVTAGIRWAVDQNCRERGWNPDLDGARPVDGDDRLGAADQDVPRIGVTSIRVGNGEGHGVIAGVGPADALEWLPAPANRL